MNSYERMLLRTKANGNNIRETQINITRRIIESKFEYDPSYIESVEIVGKKPISARINNFRKEGFLQPKMDIQSTIENEFDLGNLLHFKNEYWLVTMKNNFYDMNFEGEIVQCNNILRFQLPNQYDIYEYYCVMERPYSLNLSRDEIVQVSIKEYRVRLQLDDITKQIYLGQRFILGIGHLNDGTKKPDVYQVASRDPLSNAIVFEEGFLVLNLIEDQTQMDDDDLNYLVANYRNPPNILPIIPSECQIKSADNIYEVKPGNRSYKFFFGELFDDKGKKILDLENINFEWNIHYADESTVEILQYKYIIIDNSEKNIFKIRCNLPKSGKDVEDLLNSEFELTLKATDELNNISFNEFKTIIKITSMI